ncbi:Nn.00g070800.m01.CDS01 [Neocucurbitaria sp. VM-36]
MFSSSRTRYQEGSFSKHRASKSKSHKKNPSFRDSPRKVERLAQQAQVSSPQSNQTSPTLGSAIITISVGPEQRLFAAHEDVLSHSPWFQAACNGQFFQTANKRIDLPDEEPEVFSSILEYLYKGDYYPRMEYDKKRNSWNLENGGNGTDEAVIYSSAGPILKDTVIYCQAEKYGLQELKKLALKKQGLQSGIQCSTILTSARFAYANTPDNDSKLRAHYLALIIRARHTFKRSGTMQNEMENGGKLFFDLFVAMVNHMDDLSQKSPR